MSTFIRGREFWSNLLSKAASYFPTLRDTIIPIFFAYRVLPVNPEYKMPFENLMLLVRIELHKI